MTSKLKKILIELSEATSKLDWAVKRGAKFDEMIYSDDVNRLLFNAKNELSKEFSHE